METEVGDVIAVRHYAVPVDELRSPASLMVHWVVRLYSAW